MAPGAQAFDVNGKSVPNAGSIKKRLVFNFYFGQVAPAKALDSLLKYQNEAIKLSLRQNELSQSGYAGAFSSAGTKTGKVDYSVLDSDLLFSAYLRQLNESSGDAISYRPEPMIVVSHYPDALDSQQASGLDIISNARRSFVVSANEGLKLSPEHTLRAGVLEAMSESAAVELEYENALSIISESEGFIKGGSPKVYTKSNVAPRQIQSQEPFPMN